MTEHARAQCRAAYRARHAAMLHRPVVCAGCSCWFQRKRQLNERYCSFDCRRRAANRRRRERAVAQEPRDAR